MERVYEYSLFVNFFHQIDLSTVKVYMNVWERRIYCTIFQSQKKCPFILIKTNYLSNVTQFTSLIYTLKSTPMIIYTLNSTPTDFSKYADFSRHFSLDIIYPTRRFNRTNSQINCTTKGLSNMINNKLFNKMVLV